MNYRLLGVGLLLSGISASAFASTIVDRTVAINTNDQDVLMLSTTGQLTPAVSLTTDAIFNNFSPNPTDLTRTISGEVTRVTTASAGSSIGLYNGVMTFVGYTSVINGKTVTLTSLELKNAQAALSARGGLTLTGSVILNGVKTIDLAKAQSDVKAIVLTVIQNFANS